VTLFSFCCAPAARAPSGGCFSASFEHLIPASSEQLVPYKEQQQLHQPCCSSSISSVQKHTVLHPGSLHGPWHQEWYLCVYAALLCGVAIGRRISFLTRSAMRPDYCAHDVADVELVSCPAYGKTDPGCNAAPAGTTNIVCIVSKAVFNDTSFRYFSLDSGGSINITAGPYYTNANSTYNVTGRPWYG